ncbi:MAG: hypothetical protein C5B56_14430, partial [Proteobacteria bacterium]
MTHVDTPQSRCRFGIARCDITPPVGIYHRMWGAASHDRATGVHRPLTATALVFQPIDVGRPAAAVGRIFNPPGDAGGVEIRPTEPVADALQVIVAVDLCLLWAKEMDNLLTHVCAATGLERQQLAVTFSHTHAAGLMGLERGNLPGGDLIAPFLDTLATRIADIVQQARASGQPVNISYGAGRCSLAAQRDFFDAVSGQYVCGFNPEAPADDTVLVARITTTHGQPVATIVNYACHPTTLAWQNTLISPDYPGAMRELVETATGVPCVFLQGASGDLGPREGFVGDTAVADR